MSETNIGTQIKIALSLNCANLSMDEYDFVVSFFTTQNKAVVIAKSEMIRESETQYVAIVDTAQMPAGEIKMRVEADIPDSYCANGLRKEIMTTSTNITIRR